MGPGFMSSPSFQSSSSSSATGGNSLSPWYQGDIVVAGGSVTQDRATGQGILNSPALLAGIVVVGFLVWRSLAK